MFGDFFVLKPTKETKELLKQTISKHCQISVCCTGNTNTYKDIVSHHVILYQIVLNDIEVNIKLPRLLLRVAHGAAVASGGIVNAKK